MADMPRPRPPYLHRFKTRHGRFIWYMRRPGHNRVRLRAEFGTPEFQAQYDAAISGQPVTQGKTKAASGSVAWLWERYRETDAWGHLGSSTRKQRENIILHVLAKIGPEPCASITKKEITASRDARSGTPAQARNFLDCMRGLFRWALEADHVKIDPTAGVRNPKRPKTKGFEVWTEDEVDRYHARWPLGTKERVWIDTLLYSGLRRGDVVRLGKQHVKDGLFSLPTEKSGEMVLVCNPVLPVLTATWKAGPTADLAFICGERRTPLTKESFGNYFRVACDEAGVFGKSAHGLRKVGATRAAENGATVSQLMALFGWTDPQMAALYTKAADRKRLARDAGKTMQRTPDEHPMCPPNGKVGTAREKD
jgi:integrase